MADPIVKRPGQGSRRIDPTTLMRLQSLELRARTILEGFMQGLHRSPYHGASVEFSEYRAYTAGDDTRHIDWKLYARTDRYCIKKFEAETNLRCQLMVDLTRSMRFGSLEYTLLFGEVRSSELSFSDDEYSAELADACLAYLAAGDNTEPE